MVLPYIFFISGLVLVILMLTKRMEERRKSNIFLLKWISRGEERSRELHHEAVRLYSLGKERAHFFVMKQLPRYSKSSVNKTLARFEENMQKHLERLRDSHLLKKQDGISEFFKSMSEVEKGNGEINEDIYIQAEPPIVPKPKQVRKPVGKKLKVEQFVETE
ncbi:MAG: hypothetical protein UY47_C0005G0029 [Parcubacteria group bacterium GW2011_GWB1_49_7]|uniref:Uncharacterized protein n=1 Tax=Candidatus Zambryskibacteria bacterium RIFCSPHIGHO2_01_FULL_46_25 TaxID=1802738 RepID=A0A1G2SZL5_9BACT|nr:MAG: hypothetical protein UX71_C0005G0049 [Parcubacteria group bacterium GW2011_GWA1_47_10]KKW09786.1 MAG: hypothetical protein UY47_C0005G0029 [Parcubacteria group bacterium GW2011_GWB1_49_7]OHA90302.1 MAG: hypothetical protein A2838_01730 [Candidatus Zambryskibacteria bacterium RIFCSPHIGHO2_01_FULL_46_25]OHB01700.1 MAG: hypothetical protein A3F53_01810 [Candidatus Zambryskibacteria bacterium RIFCSPHIGHO2_12_FULL_48_10]OHB06842.1 MAG: hypothetical protein A3A31_00875 [Candidatus Zambryskiba